MKTCKECKHFAPEPKEKGSSNLHGFCHRYPRIKIRGGWMFPYAHANDHCGEFFINDYTAQKTTQTSEENEENI